jgi:hypothetical protein
VGGLTLAVSQAAAFPSNIAASTAAPSNVAKAQWAGTQWIDPRCVNLTWPNRCPYRLTRRHGPIVSEFDFSGCAYPYRGACDPAYFTVPHWSRWRDSHRWYGWDAY